MIIQFNSSQHIEGSVRLQDYFTGVMNEEFSRFSHKITRIEIHLSDENGDKPGPKDKKCLMEARIEGKSPTVVEVHGNSYEECIKGAMAKLKTVLKNTFERLNDHSVKLPVIED
ncbi:MAG TPA: HPF/RaiA family ribosome-associated protein [Catalimonadaceae bacterium]|nr:HPF/RaiA family ribosome-associated protein [Catalimonadaceae bacterium]